MQRIGTILLAALMVFVTMGFSLNHHYCGGKLKATSLYNMFDSSSCCGDKEMPMDCCHDEVEYFQLDEDFQLDSFVAEWQVDLIALIPVVVLAVLEDTEDTHPHYLNYKPPLLPADIPVLVQSFLI